MKTNIGTIDRILRVILGIGLLSLLFLLDGGARWIGLIGIVLLGTALFSFCPIYAVFGLNSKPATES